jgi:hypothetical protein
MEDSDGEGAKKKQRCTCKHPGCLKHPALKGFCILHARQELGASVVAAFYQRVREAPSIYCKHPNCKKRKHIQGYCQVHAKEVLGEDVVPDSRTIVTNYCKFSGCSKRRSLKCFCMEHAREELDPEVVEEHLSKRRERDAKRKRGDDGGDSDS